MKLTWDPNKESDLAGYRVYQGRQSSTYALQQTLPKTQTTAEITGLKPGQYYFAVTAFDTQSYESGFSNEIAHIESEAIMSVKVVLNWAPVTTYEDGSLLPAGYTCTYDVFRGEQSNMSDRSKINPMPLTVTGFEDTTVALDKSYSYQVQVGSNPQSELSDIVSVQTTTKKPAQPQGLSAVVVTA